MGVIYQTTYKSWVPILHHQGLWVGFQSQGSGYAKLRVKDVKSIDVASKVDVNASKRSHVGRNVAKSRCAALRRNKGESKWMELKVGKKKSK